jgi:hypothetical protein
MQREIDFSAFAWVEAARTDAEMLAKPFWLFL